MILLPPSCVFLPLLRASLLSVVSLLVLIHPVLAESGVTSNTSVPETVSKTVPNTTASAPDSSVKAVVPLEVQVMLIDEADTELQMQLPKEISLSLLEKDEFPAQTDFLFKRAEKELFNALKAFGYYQPSIKPRLERQKNVTGGRVRSCSLLFFTYLSY